MDAFEAALQGAMKAVQSVAGRTVLYCVDEDSAEVTAVVGRSQIEVMSEGILIAAQSRDYLILAENLVVNDEQVIPARGHIIRETIDGVACAFEVLPPTGKLEYDYSGTDHFEFRIHTKQIE